MESGKKGAKKKGKSKSVAKGGKKDAKDKAMSGFPSLYQKEKPVPPEIKHIPPEYKLMDKKQQKEFEKQNEQILLTYGNFAEVESKLSCTGGKPSFDKKFKWTAYVKLADYDIQRKIHRFIDRVNFELRPASEYVDADIRQVNVERS